MNWSPREYVQEVDGWSGKLTRTTNRKPQATFGKITVRVLPGLEAPRKPSPISPNFWLFLEGNRPGKILAHGGFAF
jgi:hypothetical protein